MTIKDKRLEKVRCLSEATSAALTITGLRTGFLLGGAGTSIAPRCVLALSVGIPLYSYPVLCSSSTHSSPGIDVAPVGTHVRTYVSDSGVPVVNIAKANKAGLSSNFYTRFDVGLEGLALNNSVIEDGVKQSSLLAGTVVFNPNLDEPATLILNQVISTSRSQLNGSLEVVGSSADVVVANPNGISCSGCSFQNIDRITLSTGLAYLSDEGALKGLDVNRGTIEIEEKGMSAEQAIDLVTRGITLKGPVNSSNDGDLSVVAGVNDWAYQTGEVKNSERADIAPKYAFDSQLLGGLTAGNITITATEEGVGVRSAGPLLATVGGFNLNAKGKIEVGGRLTAAAGRGVITSKGDILFDSNGEVRAKALEIVSNGVLNNRGLIGGLGQSAQKIRADAIVNEASGKLLAIGDVDIEADSGVLTNRGRISSRNGNLSAKAMSIENEDSATFSAGSAVSLQAVTGAITNAGKITAGGGDLYVKSKSWENERGGEVVASKVLDMTITHDLRNAGHMEGKESIDLRTTVGSIDNLNDAKILSGGKVTIDADSGEVMNAGKIEAKAGNLSISSVAFGNMAGADAIASKLLEIDVIGVVNNSGYLLGKDGIDLSAGSLANNSFAALVSLNDARLQIVKGDFDNKGSIYTKGDFDLALLNGKFVNRSDEKFFGTIESEGDISIVADEFENRSQMNAAGDFEIEARVFLNAVQGNVERLERSTYGVSKAEKLSTEQWYTFPDHHKATYFKRDWLVEEVLVDGYPSYQPVIYSGGDLTIKGFTDGKNIGGILSAGRDLTLKGKSGFDASFVNDNLSLKKTYWRETWNHYIHYVGLNTGFALTYENDESKDRKSFVTGVTTDSGVGASIVAGGVLKASQFSLNNLSGQYSPAPVPNIPSNLVKVSDSDLIDDAVSSSVSDRLFGELNDSLSRILDERNRNGSFVAAINQDYLIQSNSRYGKSANRYNGSDTLATALGIESNEVGKRLGDADYEAYLVRQQLMQLKGLVGPSSASEAEHIKALWTNAASEANESDLNLKWGIALTQEQIGKLDRDIIWMVRTIVKGEEVLVPKVYLAPKTSLEIAKGAVIGGTNVELTDMESVTNAGGTISAKTSLVVKGKNDISNLSGILRGGQVEVLSKNGSIVNETVQVFGDGSKREGVTFEIDEDDTVLKNVYTNGEFHTSTGKAAGIFSTKGALKLEAHSDVIIKGADIDSKGDASLITKSGDVRIESIENITVVTNRSDVQGGYEYKTESTITNTGSNLEAGGKLTIQSARDIKIKGSDVAASSLDAIATGEFELVAASDSTTESARSTSQKWAHGLSLWSDTSADSYSYKSRVKQAGIKVTSGSAVIKAAEVSVKGSTIDARSGIDIAADTVKILEDHDRDYNRTDKKETELFKVHQKDTSLVGYETQFQGNKNGVQSKDGGKFTPTYAAALNKPRMSLSAAMNAQAKGTTKQGIDFASHETLTEFYAKETGVSAKLSSSAGSVKVSGRNSDGGLTNQIQIVGSDVEGLSVSLSAEDVRVLAGRDIHYEREEIDTHRVGLDTELNGGVGKSSSVDLNAAILPNGNIKGDAGAGADLKNRFGYTRTQERSLAVSSVAKDSNIVATGAGALGDISIKAEGGIAHFEGATLDARRNIDISADNIVNKAANSKKVSKVSTESYFFGKGGEWGVTANAGVEGSAGVVQQVAGAFANAGANAKQGYRADWSKTSKESRQVTYGGNTFKADRDVIRRAKLEIKDAATTIDAGRDIIQSAHSIIEEIVQNENSLQSEDFFFTAGIGVYAGAQADANASASSSLGVAIGASIYDESARNTLRRYRDRKRLVKDRMQNVSGQLLSRDLSPQQRRALRKESRSLNTEVVRLDREIGKQIKRKKDVKDKTDMASTAKASASAAAGLGFVAGFDVSGFSRKETVRDAVVSRYTSGRSIEMKSATDIVLQGAELDAKRGDVDLRATDGKVELLAAVSSAEVNELDYSAQLDGMVIVKGTTGFNFNASAEGSSGEVSRIREIGAEVRSGGNITISGSQRVKLQGAVLEAASDIALSSTLGEVEVAASRHVTEGSARTGNAELGLSTIGSKEGHRVGSGGEQLEQADQNIGFGFSMLNYKESRSSGSQLEAMGNITIKSLKSQTLVGSQLKAADVDLISSYGDVLLLEALDTTDFSAGGMQAGLKRTGTSGEMDKDTGDIDKSGSRDRYTSAFGFDAKWGTATTSKAVTIDANDLSLAAFNIQNESATINGDSITLEEVVRGTLITKDLTTNVDTWGEISSSLHTFNKTAPLSGFGGGRGPSRYLSKVPENKTIHNEIINKLENSSVIDAVLPSFYIDAF